MLSSYLTIAQFVKYLDNMKAQADTLEQFIWELRRSFRELAAAADRALEPLGLEARAI